MTRTHLHPPPPPKKHKAIIDHQGAASQSDEAAWLAEEEPRPVSKYAEALPQLDNGVKVCACGCVGRCNWLVLGGCMRVCMRVGIQ